MNCSDGVLVASPVINFCLFLTSLLKVPAKRRNENDDDDDIEDYDCIKYDENDRSSCRGEPEITAAFTRITTIQLCGAITTVKILPSTSSLNEEESASFFFTG